MEWLAHVDSAVDPGLSQQEQVAAVKALVLMLNQGKVSINDIILHMRTYLTTSDYMIRSRGMIFLGELLTHIRQMPLEDHVIQSLTKFFIARLEDSACLRGALTGCITLVKRSTAKISSEDVRGIFKAFESFEVQSTVQQDRILCFQLLNILLEQHSSVLAPLGTLVIEEVSRAIDGEKDPRCLLVAFHLVEHLGSIFSDPHGPLAEKAADLFDIISCYFPISFNLRPNDSQEITRDDLVMSLQRAFSSSSCFASESIPFLLEKLSSSVKDAKLQSLSFIGACALAYGAGVMQEFASPLWVSLKAELFPHLSSFYAEFDKPQDAEVINAATHCLTQCIRAFEINTNTLLKLVLEDEVCNDFVKYLELDANFQRGDVQLHLKTIGQVFSAAARASSNCSIIISKMVLPAFISKYDVRGNDLRPYDVDILEVVVSVLGAVRDVAVQQDSSLDTTWLEQVYSLIPGLVRLFSMWISSAKDGRSSSAEHLMKTCLFGLQCLATFPGYLSSLPDEEACSFVSKPMDILLHKGEYAPCWTQSVEYTSAVCENQDRFSNLGISTNLLKHIVEDIVQAATSEKEDTRPYMHAIACISKASRSARDLFITELQKHMKLCDGKDASTRSLIVLLQSLSEVFHSLYENDLENIHVPAFQICMKIWSSTDTLSAVSDEVLLPLLDLMRVCVSLCDVNGQQTVILKAFDIIQLHEAAHTWLVALFSSVAVSARPEFTLLQDVKVIKLLLRTSLSIECSTIRENIHETLASIVNKWCTKAYELDDVIHFFLTSEEVTPNVVNLLSWLAKGLAMRGHAKVADIAAILLNTLKEGGDEGVRNAAAKGLNIIMRDSKALNKQYFANIRPLYKQRFFNSLLHPFPQALKDAKDHISRAWLIRGFSNLILDTPVTALLCEGEKVFPLLLEGLPNLASNAEDSDILHGNLLILSSFLVEGDHAIVGDHINTVVNRLGELTQYRYSMAVRQTSLQCIAALAGLPYAAIYPSTKQILKILRRSLDDPKRAVRNEAARCYQAWTSMSSKAS